MTADGEVTPRESRAEEVAPASTTGSAKVAFVMPAMPARVLPPSRGSDTSASAAFATTRSVAAGYTRGRRGGFCSLLSSTARADRQRHAQSFDQRDARIEARQKLQREATAIRTTLHERGKLINAYVLLPEKNAILVRWDLLTSLALIYTAAVTPFETAFVPPVVGPAAWRDYWFVANRALDIIFFLDMGLQFFVAYQTGNDYGGRTWVVSHKAIIRHYLTGWFALDASTVFVPCGFDLYLASDAFDSSGGGAATDGLEGKMSILRVLRGEHTASPRLSSPRLLLLLLTSSPASPPPPPRLLLLFASSLRRLSSSALQCCVSSSSYG